MATIKKFEEIEAWKRARQLTKDIYRISGESTFRRDFALRDQIRRAAVSIMANIAEGFEREGTGEFLQFLAMAKGSAGEVRAHLYVALDQDYVEHSIVDRLIGQVLEISRLISGLMSYLRKSGLRGSKYRPKSGLE